MKIKITALSNNIYQFADKTTSDNDTGIWRGRIVNAPDISRNFSDLGSVASTLYIQLINHDLQIPLTEDLWNASIDVETDSNYKWSGKVSAYETNADGKMYITATETTAPEYSRYIPDEFARLVSIDEDVHMSALNVTIPTVIGGNANNPIPVKGILKSKSDAIYYLCIGEIHDIVKVRVGDTTMTRAQAEAKGYMCYTGSASQTNEPGIAYIKITDTSKRLNDDGSYVDIGAEVVGLKLGSHTVEECRNGARFLYWLLKTASSGVCGWGLGISTNDIDTASFETAMTYVDLIGLKLDGVMYDNRSAQNWIDEICRAIRGTYEIGTDSKRRLSIDVASTSSYTYTKDNIELVRFGAGAFTGRVYNKGTLDYCYNPITGMFMQTSQYQNAESIARIDEQLFEGESYLIRDAETAQKIVEYTCKKSLVEANKILFNTRFLPENCRIGTVITINYPEKGMNNSLFKITSLQIGDHINRIEAVKYDESIYASGSVSATVAWQNDRPVVFPVSAPQVSGLALDSDFDILPDGTGTASILGSFTMPQGMHFTAVIEYGEGLEPENWFAVGLLKSESFKVSPVKANRVYSVRIRLITSTGHSDFVVGSINTVGDTVAPPPPVVALSSLDKSIIVKCAVDNPPYDMGGFSVYRKRHDSSVYALVGNVAADRGYANFVDSVPEYALYYYKAASYDRSGNLSDFSNEASIATTGMVSSDIAATALSMPQGSILRLSAKGCTTESIKEENGVKDVSGYGHHGRAYGGVEAVLDTDMGAGFSFNASAAAPQYIKIARPIDFSGDFTVVFDIRANDLSKIPCLFDCRSTANDSNFYIGTKAADDNRIRFVTRAGGIGSVYLSELELELNRHYQMGFSYGSENAKLRIYINGVLDSEHSVINKNFVVAAESFIGSFYNRPSNRNAGLIIPNFRIYQRRLSDTDFKTLYMLPQEALFGQANADMIGANAVHACNIFVDDVLRTLVIDAVNAKINDLNVSGNATFISNNQTIADNIAAAKSQAVSTSASDATAKANNAKSQAISTAASDATTKVKAVTDNIYTPNTTTINGGRITTGSVTAEKIATDALKSRNFTDTAQAILDGQQYATQGTFFNLAQGSITSRNFRLDRNGNVAMRGYIEATSGKIAHFLLNEYGLSCTTSLASKEVITVSSSEHSNSKVKIGYDHNGEARLYFTGKWGNYDYRAKINAVSAFFSNETSTAFSSLTANSLHFEDNYDISTTMSHDYISIRKGNSKKTKITAGSLEINGNNFTQPDYTAQLYGVFFNRLMAFADCWAMVTPNFGATGGENLVYVSRTAGAYEFFVGKQSTAYHNSVGFFFVPKNWFIEASGNWVYRLFPCYQTE